MRLDCIFLAVTSNLVSVDVSVNNSLKSAEAFKARDTMNIRKSSHFAPSPTLRFVFYVRPNYRRSADVGSVGNIAMFLHGRSFENRNLTASAVGPTERMPTAGHRIALPRLTIHRPNGQECAMPISSLAMSIPPLRMSKSPMR